MSFGVLMAIIIHGMRKWVLAWRNLGHSITRSGCASATGVIMEREALDRLRAMN